ncbi:MAG TPA: tyrosine-protein phosphatase [Tepidisphaeraceae bacterium]|nr:tyrosine-protein phosphatase [Tepidisphaeraceae bacterium]
MNAWLISAVLVVVVAVVTIWRRFFETYHLATVDRGKLYRDGNRGLREYRNMLRKVRPRTVITLIDNDEAADPAKPEFAAEESHLHARPGIRLEKVTIPLGGWPDALAIARFLSIATDPAQQPVVVHCAQGVRRTGMMVAAYQMSVLGWSKEQAKQKLLTFGHSQRTVGDVQRFIDVYDPQSRQMRETFAQSKE